MEFYRAQAFAEGFFYDRSGATIPKPPMLRSFWLPIDPEGTYTCSITSRTNSGDTVQLAVQFHCTVGTETHSDQNAIYHMVLERGAWRVAEVTTSDGFSLKRFLTRERYMEIDPA